MYFLAQKTSSLSTYKDLTHLKVKIGKRSFLLPCFTYPSFCACFPVIVTEIFKSTTIKNNADMVLNQGCQFRTVFSSKIDIFST